MTHSYVWHDWSSMTLSFVCHDSFTCVTWLIPLCNMTPLCETWLNYMCETWLNSMCDITRFCVRHDSRLYDMTQSCVWHDSAMCVTWLSHVCDMTQSCVWRDSVMFVTWLSHVCDMSQSCAWPDSVMCVYVWNDSLFRCSSIRSVFPCVRGLQGVAAWRFSRKGSERGGGQWGEVIG